MNSIHKFSFSVRNKKKNNPNCSIWDTFFTCYTKHHFKLHLSFTFLHGATKLSQAGIMKRQHRYGCYNRQIQQLSRCFLTKTLYKSTSIQGRKPELSSLFYLPYQEPETSNTRALAPTIIWYSKVVRLVDTATKVIFNKQSVIPSTHNMQIKGLIIPSKILVIIQLVPYLRI